MPYHYLLFDLDNTLLDFNASEAYALRKTFEDRGVEFTTHIESTYHKINKWCWTQFEANKLSMAQLKPLRMELTLNNLQLDLDHHQFSETYHGHLGDTDFFVPGALELIEAVSHQYQLILITNGIAKVQQARLEKTGLKKHFPTIVISESIGISKPHQAFFDYTFQQMGHPPKENVLVIGDSLSSDIKGGHNYGVDTCWHNFKKIENEHPFSPTYEVKSIAEIHSILR